MSPETSDEKITGKLLNEQWGIKAKDSKYRKTGDWYHPLREFPGVFFDANGYILFDTEEEYKNNPFLRIRKDVNVPKGIAMIPGYIHFSELKQTGEEAEQQPIPQASDTTEPTRANRTNAYISRVVRDTKLSQRIKVFHEYKCQICQVSLELSDGLRYAEAHHIKPLGMPHNGPDIAANLICVCPNHHALLDYGAIKLDKAELSFRQGHDIGDEYIEYHNTAILR